MAVVEVDASGRFVIPKGLREELRLKERTRFLLIKTGEGQLLFQKLDVDEMARRLQVELARRDVGKIVKKVREDISKKVRARYPDLLA